MPRRRRFLQCISFRRRAAALSRRRLRLRMAPKLIPFNANCYDRPSAIIASLTTLLSGRVATSHHPHHRCQAEISLRSFHRHMSLSLIAFDKKSLKPRSLVSKMRLISRVLWTRRIRERESRPTMAGEHGYHGIIKEGGRQMVRQAKSSKRDAM